MKRLVELLAGLDAVRRHAKDLSSASYILQRRGIFEEFSIDLVLDVGANVGRFGRDLRTFYRGDIISFEPVSAAFRSLARTAARDPLWRCCNVALGSQDTVKIINVARNLVFSSFLETNAFAEQSFGEASRRVREEMVSVRRLDGLLDEIVPDFANRRVFLKLDTQGFDTEVINGLGSMLGNVSVLQSEVSVMSIYEGMSHWTDSISCYEKEGFELAGLYPVTLVSGRVVEFDCLMARSSGRV
jgi:FkbM family methyltransferase